jgi:cyclase
MIGRVAAKCFVPLAVAGGITTADQVHYIIRCGAEKIAVNSALPATRGLVGEIATRFGSQCVIASVDVGEGRHGPEVMIRGGSEPTGLDPLQWARELQNQGAGEILVNSIERDGSKLGYDLRLIGAVARTVHIPVIACGGAGAPEHFVELLRMPGVAAAAAANIFAFTEHSVLTIKACLAQAGIDVRGETYADYRTHGFDPDGRVAKQPDADLDQLVFEYVPEEMI